MTEGRRRPWFCRIADGLMAVLLVNGAIWLVLVGHVMATCPHSADRLGWATLILITLPALGLLVVLPWLGLVAGVAWLRPTESARRFWLILAWTLAVALTLALALGVTEHLMGVRNRCSLG